MKQWLWSVSIGSAIGAALAIVIGFSVMSGSLPFKSTDVFGFVLTTLALIVGVFTVIGAIAVVNTWNDIETKSRILVTKQIDEITSQREAHLEETKRQVWQIADKQDKAIRDQIFYIWVGALTSSWLITLVVNYLLNRRSRSK